MERTCERQLHATRTLVVNYGPTCIKVTGVWLKGAEMCFHRRQRLGWGEGVKEEPVEVTAGG